MITYYSLKQKTHTAQSTLIQKHALRDVIITSLAIFIRSLFATCALNIARSSHIHVDCC